MSQTKSFEDNLSKLTEIIQQMEQQDVGLEDSLKLYEQGINLTRKCQTIIDEAEKKIEKLMDQKN